MSETIRLRHCFTERFTGAWGGEPEEENSFVCIRAADIETHAMAHAKVDLTKRSYDENEFARKQLRANDLIIEKSGGGDNQPVGRVVLFDLSEPATCSNFLEILRPAHEKLNSKYGAYLLYSIWSQRLVDQHIKKTTGIQNLDGDSYFDQRVWLPSLETQRRIADYLDRETAEIDALIEAKEQMLALLEEKRAALVSRAVTKGLNPDVPMKDSGLEWLGEIPAHWKVSRAKRFFREIDERTETGEETLLSLRMEIGLVPHDDVSEKPILDSELIGYKITRPNQIVINRMRVAIGLIAVTPQLGLVSPDYAVFENIENLQPFYFVELFKSSLLQSLFRSESKGLGTGSSGFLRLYSDNFLL